MSALEHRAKGPLSWWLYPETGHVVVRCSQAHPSLLLHHVREDGALVSPDGQSPSCHCGKCAEDLPRQLDGWTHGRWTGPDPMAPYTLPNVTPSTCARCGTMSKSVGGWGTHGAVVGGIICPECRRALDTPTTPSPEDRK